MAKKSERNKRRSFGKILKMRSGRYQASYIGPAGNRVYAPNTFERHKDADTWLSGQQTDIARNQWISDDGFKVTLGEYAIEYLDQDAIGDSWRATCEVNLRLHMDELTGLSLRELTPRRVRRWYNKIQKSKCHGPTSVAQSYRFLRAVMNQAVRDELISRNPCNVPGAGSTDSPERRIASPEQVQQLFEEIEPWYRAPVALAAWCSLRRGEIIALKPNDIDLKERELYVEDSKTRAGIRVVSIPPHVVPALESARKWSDENWFFTSPRGGRMVANSFYHAFRRARSRIGLDYLTIHDLRHTGNSLAAATGANLKDLMYRLGHSSDAIAKRYLHTVDGRDQEIAEELSKIADGDDPAKLPKRLKGA
ncbi:tyrosine-type recombinase/integrase [Haloglycomyces albus]|uniref:tyrosine-type recombinase/integrase n=1 Tax=Haloglycomyces albus TaxID=526067 RepID=UPI00046D6E66|nr:site-specific integrase [Haloglycomyces albus]